MVEQSQPMRGTISRVPADGMQGVIANDGGQWSFELERTWQSPGAPMPGQAVEFTTDAQGVVTRVVAVTASQLAAEKLRQATGAAAEWAQGPGKEKLMQATDAAAKWAKGPGREKLGKGLTAIKKAELEAPQIARDGHNFVYGKTTVEFSILTGEVMSSDKYSETHVHGGGGGGYVTTGALGHVHGSTSPVRISSTVDRTHEFWLRAGDGTEHAVRLAHHDIPLRAGQKVSLISFRSAGASNGWYSALVNHSAGRHWHLFRGQGINKKLGVERYTGMSILIAAGIYLLINTVLVSPLFLLFAKMGWTSAAAAMGGISLVAVVLAIAYVIYRFFRRSGRIAKVGARLDEHQEALIREAYAKG